jgi:hypothetical protein
MQIHTHPSLGALERELAPQAAAGPTGPPRDLWGPGNHTGKVVLNTAPPTFNQRVAPSRARRGYGDGDLTVRSWTQPMQRNGVPVQRVAVRELAGEDTEEREHNSSAVVQKRQERGVHVKGVLDRIDVDGGPGPDRRSRAETLSTAGYGAWAASQVKAVCEHSW